MKYCLREERLTDVRPGCSRPGLFFRERNAAKSLAEVRIEVEIIGSRAEVAQFKTKPWSEVNV